MWYGTREQLRERVRQWSEVNRWQETEDPHRIRPPEEALRWSGEVREARLQAGESIAHDDGSGLVLMHEALAKFPSKG